MKHVMLVCDIWLFAKKNAQVALTGRKNKRSACFTVFTYTFIWESETDFYSLGRENNTYS